MSGQKALQATCHWKKKQAEINTIFQIKIHL